MTADNLTKRRILMMLIGVPLVGVSVAFFNVAEFGVDPFTVLVQGSFHQMPSSISYGLTYSILSVIELIAIILLDRKKIGVGTLINLFLLGYITDYTSRFLRFALGDMIGTMPIRILFMIIGVTLLSFSSGIYFTANMGVSTHDAVSLIASEKQDKVPFQYCRVISDALCVIFGTILGGTFGIGTIVAAVFCGPLVAFFRKHIGEPMLHYSIHRKTLT